MTPHFTLQELTCPCGCGLLPKLQSVQRLEQVRVVYGKPMKLSSAARCPEYNAKVSTTGLNGPHTLGAFDVLVSGHNVWELIQIAMEYGFTGIGVSQRGPHEKRFIHLDDILGSPVHPRPWVWSY